MPHDHSTAEALTPEQLEIAEGFERLRSLLHPRASSSGSNRDGESLSPHDVFPPAGQAAVPKEVAAADAPPAPAEVDGFADVTATDHDGGSVLAALRHEREDLHQRLVEQRGELHALKRERALAVDPKFDDKDAAQVKGLVNGMRRAERAKKLDLLLSYERSKDQPREDVVVELEEQADRAMQADAAASAEDRSG